MGVREGKVEKHLKDSIKKLGGTSYKWPPSPGVDGVPDQIVILFNRVWFVEIKTVDGKLGVTQKRTLPKLAPHYNDTFVLYGQNEVDNFLNEEVLPWLKQQLETTCIAQNVVTKGCPLSLTKHNQAAADTNVQAAISELRQRYTQNPKFYPPSKVTQLNRKSGL